MTLKSDEKFKEKLTCGVKYDMRKLVNFHPITQKLENFTSMGFIKFKSENVKMTWSIRLFIFCITCNFSECNGFTVL